ncbi:dual specificity protein phosphatase 7-like [Acanthaster planci]|uniref:Dual specificity protein phosphatase n=1 Tax=Acanthaster planci TaxID=133434 RepID=A0A8B7ZH52_ACAPL|nr:dual specificity protein phosphatase 7-like [Acanthaster planci]
MPEQSDVFFRDMMALATSPECLGKQLLDGGEVMLLDYRPNSTYTRSHIEGAWNLSVPGILLRRLKRGKVAFKCLIHGDEGKEMFVRKSRSVPVVLYDDGSTDVNANSDSPFVLLLKKLQEEGCRATYLKGGFNCFKEQYPPLCVTQQDDNSDSDSGSITDLGFDNLKIDACHETDSETPLDNRYPVEILPYLFLGSKQDSENLELLHKLGIKCILNVTPNIPNCFESNGLKYMQIPVPDHWSQNLAKFFPEAIEFIDEARKVNHGILVHCLAGVSRSVTVTVAYLMQKLCLTLNDAYDFVKKRKNNISPNFNFMGQLLEFEQQLRDSPCRGGDCSCSKEGRRLCMSPDPVLQSLVPSAALSSSSSTSSSASSWEQTPETSSRKIEFNFTVDS